MKNAGKKLLQENKGFSLVELLIAVCIASIIGMSLVALVQSSSNLYNHNNAELDVQTGAQLTANAITDRVIDCETQLKFYDGSTDTFPTPVAYGTDASGTALTASDAKVLQLINANKQITAIIFFVSAKEAVYYNEAKWNDDIDGHGNGGWEPFKAVDAELLADKVTDFVVYTDKLDTDKVLAFDVTYASRSKTYKGSYQVHMRNDVVEGSNATPMPPAAPEVSQIIITPKTAYLEIKKIDPNVGTPNMSIPGPFDATVRGSAGIVRTVSWTTNPADLGTIGVGVEQSTNTGAVTGNKYTFMRSGVSLPDPTVKSFKLEATSQEDSTKRAYATIFIKKAIGVMVEPKTPLKSEGGVPVSPKNTSIEFNAIVDGWNLTRGESTGVVWKLYQEIKGTSGFVGNWVEVTDSSRAELRNSTVVLKDSLTPDYRFKVEATSTFDAYYKNEYVFYISDKIATSNMLFLRGVNMDLKSYFLANPTKIAGDITSVLSIDGVEITGVDGYSGDFRNFISIDGNQVMYVSCDASHGGSNTRKREFYDELKIKMNVTSTVPSGRRTDATEIVLPAVSVSKLTPGDTNIVIRKGTTKDIMISTRGYNLTKTSRMSVFLDGTKVSGSGNSNLNSYLACDMVASENGASLLGTNENGVDKGKFRLRAQDRNYTRSYPEKPVQLVIALDDFYNVSSLVNPTVDAASYAKYQVYVANVEGYTLFIPGPDGEVAGVRPTAYNGLSSAYLTKNISSVRETGTGTVTETIQVKLRKNGSIYEMRYNGINYRFDNTYKYWRQIS